MRAFWRARSIRRSLDNRFIEKRRVGSYPWSQARRELEPYESQGLYEAILGKVSAIEAALAAPVASLSEAQVSDLRARLKNIAVAPGLIGTQLDDRFSTPEGRAQIVRDIPLGREGTAE